MAKKNDDDPLDRVRVVAIEKSESLLSKVKKIIEVSAILIGGIWAYYNFTVKDKPELKEALVSGSTIKITSLSRDSCQLQYSIEAKNIGKSSFDVDTLILSYWTFPISVIKKNKFFDIDDYTNRHHPDASYIKTDANALLATGFPAGFNKYQDFTFFLRRDTNKGIIFKHELHGTASGLLFGKTHIKSVGHQWVFHITPGNSGDLLLPSENNEEEK